MNKDRRDILTSLGIIVAGAGVVSTEALAKASEFGGEDWKKKYPTIPLMAEKGPKLQSAIADALEAMAKSIRNRELIAGTMAVHSELKDDWLSHTVTVNVEMPRDAEGARKVFPPQS
jgi:hypothetical protein